MPDYRHLTGTSGKCPIHFLGYRTLSGTFACQTWICLVIWLVLLTIVWYISMCYRTTILYHFLWISATGYRVGRGAIGFHDNIGGEYCTLYLIIHLCLSLGTYWLFVGIASLGFVFFWCLLPETKGRKLEDVEELFARPWCRCCGDDNTDDSIHYRRLNSWRLHHIPFLMKSSSRFLLFRQIKGKCLVQRRDSG